MSEQDVEEKDRNLKEKGLLFEQLLQSDKFTSFFYLNYDLVRDDDTKDIFLVEVPDSVARERAAEMMKEQVKESSGVVPATEDDLCKLVGKKDKE